MPRVLFAGVSAIAALAFVVGCGGDGPSGGNAAPASTELPARPDAAKRAEFLAALRAVDPVIVDGKEERAVDHGLHTCVDIAIAPGRIGLLTNAQVRFGDDVVLSNQQAEVIIAAVQKYLCPPA